MKKKPIKNRQKYSEKAKATSKVVSYCLTTLFLLLFQQFFYNTAQAQVPNFVWAKKQMKLVR